MSLLFWYTRKFEEHMSKCVAIPTESPLTLLLNYLVIGRRSRHTAETTQNEERLLEESLTQICQNDNSVCSRIRKHQ